MNNNRARLYGRYSTNMQREESIEGQFRECQEYADKHGLVITGEYADRALSGKFSESRSQFLRMIKDAEKGQFDVLLVYKMDRFARNRYDAAVYKYRLRKAGVKVISVREHIPEGAEGIILESVLEGYAEYFSANLAENVRRGAKDTALEAKFNGGQVPYGYKIVDGEYKADEARAEVVREVFARYAAGETYRGIYTALNERGLRTLKGKPFSRGSVASILNNEKYIGQFIYNIGDGDKVEIEGGCPALVSQELWQAVQKRRESSTGKPRLDKGVIKYVLSGKIFCPLCGDTYHGFSCVANGVQYSYYKHNRLDGVLNCENKNMIRRDKLNDRVFAAIKENVLTPESIDSIANAAAELQKEDYRLSAGAYVSELAEVNTAIENIYKAIEQGIFSDGLKARLNELENRASELASAITGATQKTDYLTPEMIKEYLMQFMHGNIDDESFREKVLSTFVKRIEIERGIVRLFLHYAADEESEKITFVFDNCGFAYVTKAETAQDAGILLFT